MMQERVHVTPDGLKKLEEELEHLIKEERPRVVRDISEAREHGDLRENAAYDSAKHEQTLIERRIREIEQMLKRVEIIKDGAGKGSGVVELGSTVTVRIDGVEETYTIVGAVEAKPREGRISNESPIGQALLGATPGDEVRIETPGQPINAEVVSIE